MKTAPLPARRSPVARIIFWSVIGLLAAALLTVVAWKWETLGYIVNSGAIIPKQRSDILRTLDNGAYTVVSREEDTIRYTVMDDSIDVNATFDGDKLRSLDIRFNYHSIPMRTVSEAVQSADLLLGPYFSMPQIEAIAVILGAELGAHAAGDTINHTTTLAGYDLYVDGNAQDGAVYIALG